MRWWWTLGLFTPSAAFAWSYCGTWAGDASYDLCFGDTPGVCDGPWADAVIDAMDAWSAVQGAPVYLPQIGTPGGIGANNGQHEAAWLDQATYQTMWGPISASAQGVTTTTFSGAVCTTIVEADLVVFTDFDWSLDRAAADAGPEAWFPETVAHELGHASSFGHEDTVLTLMNSYDHEPSMLGVPHGNEIDGVLAQNTFLGAVFEDVTVLPYRGNGASLVPASVSAAPLVRPGESFGVGDVQVESWGTGAARNVTLELILSRDGVVSVDDLRVAATPFFGLQRSLYGWVGQGPIVLPEVGDGAWQVIQAVDVDGLLAEWDEGNNAVVVGEIAVDAVLFGAPVPGRAGTRSRIDVTAVTPGALVHVVYGTGTTTTAVPGCPGRTVAVGALRRLGSVRADAQGRARVWGNLPAGWGGARTRFQAVDAAACTVSLVHEHTL